MCISMKQQIFEKWKISKNQSNSSFPSFLSKVLKYIQLYNTQFYVQILKKNISTRISIYISINYVSIKTM